MSKKKSIAVAIVLILVLLVGGLLALFTDTDNASNVFQIGEKIDIELTETAFVASSAQNIHPGAVVEKNPVIKNNATTDQGAAYVFLKVVVPCYASNTTVDTPLFTLRKTDGSEGVNAGWTLINSPVVNTTDKTIEYVYAYGTSSAMTSLAKATSTPALFDSVKLAETLTATQAATAPDATNIVVTAYAIQTDNLGVTTPTDIYALFNS